MSKEHNDIDIIPPYDKDKNEELIDLVVSFGIVGYPLDKILNIIPNDVDHYLFTAQFYNPDHPIAKAYQRGQDRRDFDIDIKLFNLAISGNLDALEKFERRKRMRESED
jgi:hypothetical protein